MSFYIHIFAILWFNLYSVKEKVASISAEWFFVWSKKHFFCPHVASLMCFRRWEFRLKVGHKCAFGACFFSIWCNFSDRTWVAKCYRPTAFFCVFLSFIFICMLFLWLFIGDEFDFLSNGISEGRPRIAYFRKSRATGWNNGFSRGMNWQFATLGGAVSICPFCTPIRLFRKTHLRWRSIFGCSLMEISIFFILAT